MLSPETRQEKLTSSKNRTRAGACSGDNKRGTPKHSEVLCNILRTSSAIYSVQSNRAVSCTEYSVVVEVHTRPSSSPLLSAKYPSRCFVRGPRSAERSTEHGARRTNAGSPDPPQSETTVVGEQPPSPKRTVGPSELGREAVHTSRHHTTCSARSAHARHPG